MDVDPETYAISTHHPAPEPAPMTLAPSTPDLEVVVDPFVDEPVLGPRRARAEQEKQARAERPGLSVAASSLGLLSLIVLAFLVQVGPLSLVEHARSQRVAYADLRRDLAAGTVPTGQVVGDLDHPKAVPTGTALGYLSIPDLGLAREVFFQGTTSSVLEKGPGHRRSSVLPGQAGRAVLYGRAWSYAGPFRGLGGLAKGAVNTVTTQQGESRYTVTATRHAGDRMTDPLPGKGLLTLVSAEGGVFVPERAVYVDAELVSMPFATPSLAYGTSSLSGDEDPLKGEPGAWVGVFLALQGLAIASVVLAWASRRYGGAQTWVVGAPVIVLLLVLSSQQALRLLPNLL
jgi:LPXTG-site transpeptidase (sortase) family protein